MEAETSSLESEHDLILLKMVADIVSAYVSKNAVPAADLPALIADVHMNMKMLRDGVAKPVPEVQKEPAVSVKKSVTPDFIICLEDGKRFKSLKRHLATAYGMSPEEYRAKWRLPSDYPMVAPAYAAKRSALAKQSGLGQQAKARTRAVKKGSAKKAA